MTPLPFTNALRACFGQASNPIPWDKVREAKRESGTP